MNPNLPKLPPTSRVTPAAKRPKGGAAVAKVIITASALVSTMGGWALISATAPEMQQTASVAEQISAVAQVAQAQPTAVPTATATPAATSATKSAVTTVTTSTSATTQVVARTRASR